MLFALCYRAGPGCSSPGVLPPLPAPACSLLVMGMRKPELMEPVLPLDVAVLLGQSSSPELRSVSAWLSKTMGCGEAVQQEGAGGRRSGGALPKL